MSSIYDTLPAELRAQIDNARKDVIAERKQREEEKAAQLREIARRKFDERVASAAWARLESAGLRSQVAMDMAAEVVRQYPDAQAEPKGPNGERGKGKVAVAADNAVVTLIRQQSELHAEDSNVLTGPAWAARYEKALATGQAVGKRLLVQAFTTVQEQTKAAKA